MADYAPQTLQPQAAKTIAAGQAVPTQEPLKKDTYKEALLYPSIQFKLAIGASDDPLEHEADAMADTIMRMPEQNFIQPKCSHCEEEEKLQRKPLASFIQRKESSSQAVASDAITNQINSSRGSGSNMDGPTQSFMESRFGTDFNNVKIHTSNESVQMNRELNARAFTVGNDIYFNEGQYNPNSNDGKHLLAHELTHTVQQTGTIQRQIFGDNILFDQQDSCPPEAEVQGVMYPDEQIAIELYGDETVSIMYVDDFGTMIKIEYDLLLDRWKPFFQDCISPNQQQIETPVEQQGEIIPVEQQVCRADADYTGEIEMSAAKVSAPKGIRLHTTPDVNDCDYTGRIGVSAIVYPFNTDITIIAASNKSNIGWVKIQTMDDYQGWIEERFVRRTKKDSTKDAITKSIYSIKSGDTLEKVINEEYKDYPYTTGNDRRTIAHALFILNDGETDAFYFRGDGSSWWKDTLDSDFAESRNIYATIRLKEGKTLRLPTKAYIDLLRDKGQVGVRPEWKNTAIELGRSIEGFVEGVVYGFGKAIVDTLVGLWDLLKGILTGELFEQAYEFYKQIENEGISVLWKLIEGFFIGLYNDFVAAWNNPNPYKKWFFFGEIIGMIIFEIAIAYLTAGAGLAKHLGKLSKVLDAIPGLKKIATKIASKVDDIPSKEVKALGNVKAAESKIETLGDMTGETRKMLRDPKNEKLLDSLNDNPRAAKALKKCNSPCFPEFALPEQVKQIDDILAKIDTHIDSADYDGLKSFFHEAKTPDELGEKIDIIQSGLDKFVDDKARGISPYEIDRLKKTQTIRNTSGHIKGGDGLPNINASNVAAWYDERIMQIPKQVADKLKIQFKKGVPDFKSLREAFWTEMYKDPVINDFFNTRGAIKSLEEMRNGRPPFAMSGQRTGGGANAKLQLNHQQALEHAGEAFDLDNLEIVSPVFHEAMKQ